MTPDTFTEAARAEANRYWLETLQDETVGIGDLGEHMAEWARTHLAAQEPTDAEVEAAARALDLEGAVYAFNGDRTAAETDVAARLLRMDSAKGEELQIKARAALSAARAARRDEETR